ncbi:hypothetical protein [Aporhodopirellula aestuarii]|uniref:Uncharacterized protein n=1 Tax=Aporhodopirellula aestuarii TaxID=2950107 RepID=A0ABT0UCE1_9BACT|nr:hypothetical protein [Aporhodopirellula aestuarii]MCM2374006.1 hypothetical protein [Aporhodopirellula aestuarii]
MNSRLLLELLALPLTCARSDLNRVAEQSAVLQWFVRPEGWDELRENSNLSKAWSALPQMPVQPGVCGVGVFLHRTAKFPFADDAAILPVKWCLDPQEKNRLPQSLVRCGQLVLGEMRTASSASDLKEMLDQPWCIDWAHPEWEGVEFHDLPLTADSAFAPLTVALRSALCAIPLASDFFATGEYHGGSWRVNNDTLGKKITTAFRLGFRRFAVPKSSEPVLTRTLTGLPQTSAGGSIQQCSLLDHSDPYQGTEAACEIAGHQPDPRSPLARREAWYDSIHSNQKAREFYETHLLDSAVESACTVLANNGQSAWRPTEMVSIVSNSDELAILAAKVFRPHTCHLIFTGGETGSMRSRYERVALHLAKLGFRPVPHAVRDSAASLQDISRVVAGITRGQGDILIDVTPGRRAMQMAMLQSARQSDRVLCWWQDTSVRTRRAIPVTNLTPLLWKVTVDNGLLPLCPSEQLS